MSDLIPLELQMDPFTSGYIYPDCTEPIQVYFIKTRNRLPHNCGSLPNAVWKRGLTIAA